MWLPSPPCVCVLPIAQLEVYYTSTNSLAIDTINIPIEISSAGLISKSQAVIDVPTGDAWVASFCFKVDSKHVPGLLHSFNEVTNTDHPDVSTTSNGISIFMRHYTVRVGTPALRMLDYVLRSTLTAGSQTYTYASCAHINIECAKLVYHVLEET